MNAPLDLGRDVTALAQRGSNEPHAVVVGAGFGGMASALRLRAKGYRVTLVDRCDRLGGRAQVFERNGFKFDAGPTVVTAPFLFEELFQLYDKQLADYVELVPLEPWYRYRFPDGRIFDYGGTPEDTLREILKVSPADAQGYLRLLKHSEEIFKVGFSELSDVPFHSFWFMLKQVPHLLRLGAYRTVWQLVSKYIKDDNLRRAFSLQPLLVGGNPFDTTSIYSLIHFLERKWGVHFAMGGTGALVDALGKLMIEEGITIRLGETVSEIPVDPSTRAAQGVVLESGEKLAAEAVVVNGDPPFVYSKLIDKRYRRRWTDRRIKKLQYSMGLYVLYFGTTRQYPDVAHHTIWLGERYRDLLRDIFSKKTLSDDFSLYLHRPTATDPSFAPEGCDSFYVLSPVPNLQGGQDWEQEGRRYRDKIVKALGDTILPGLEETIVEDFWMTPQDFESRYLTMHGTGFSIAPVFQQSAWFRFHNRSEDVKQLYFVGAGTHPGAGMPGTLCSAKVLDRLIQPAFGLAKQ